jgi:regulatory protein
MQEHVITRLAMADRRGLRIRIELDGEPWAEIDTEVVLKRELKKEQLLTDEDLDAIARDNDLISARRAAARLLNFRMRSVQELRNLLTERKFKPDIVAATIDYFLEKGDLNDESFARDFIHRRLKAGKSGTRKIAYQLRLLGVDARAVESALKDAANSETIDQPQAALRLAERHLRKLERYEPPVRKKKLIAFLQRSGFEGEIIRNVIDQLIRDNH